MHDFIGDWIVIHVYSPLFNADFPKLILDIEKVELGIAAGLQDRVIQTYGGLVYMDFEGGESNAAGGVYTPLDVSLLPDLYLVYNIDLGGDSGGVHADVKERWLQGNPEVTSGGWRLCRGIQRVEFV